MLLENSSVTVTAVTMAQNSTSPSLEVRGGSVTMTNTLIQGNCGTSYGGAVIWAGGNLESPGDTCSLSSVADYRNVPNPGLGEFSYYGERSPYFPLVAFSLALDSTLADAGCGYDDQRNFPRPLDGDGDGVAVCDIGAVEMPEPLLFSEGFETGTTDGWPAVEP